MDSNYITLLISVISLIIAFIAILIAGSNLLWNISKYYFEKRKKLKVYYSFGIMAINGQKYSTLSAKVVNKGYNPHSISIISFKPSKRINGYKNIAIANIDNHLNLPFEIKPQDKYDNIIIRNLNEFIKKYSKNLTKNDWIKIRVIDSISKSWYSKKIKIKKLMQWQST